MNKISVITINRNNASGLSKTIESIINQTYSNFEYIIIDGASIDGSVDIIKKYSSNIDFWSSEPDKGIYNAMNKGIQRARGEYLLFINSGDCLVDNSILKEVASQINSEDILYGHIGVYTNNKLQILQSPSQVEYFKRYQHNLPPHPACFIKKSLFDKIGDFDESYRIVSDVVWISRAFSSVGTTYKLVDKLITQFDIKGVSSDADNQQKIYNERKRFLQQEYPSYLEDFEMIYKKHPFSSAISALKRVFKLK